MANCTFTQVSSYNWGRLNQHLPSYIPICHAQFFRYFLARTFGQIGQNFRSIDHTSIVYVNLGNFSTTLIGETEVEKQMRKCCAQHTRACWWNWHLGISCALSWSNLHFTLTMNAMVKMLVQSRTKQTLKILSRKHVSDARLFIFTCLLKTMEKGMDIRSIIWLETSSIIIDHKRREIQIVPEI